MKTCLVLEGGALRGIYTAGVLDSLIKDNIKIDAIIGVSMGSLVGLNYVSNQPERAIRYNLKYCKDKHYMGFRNLLKTGDIVNKEFAYYKIPNELDPFDYQTFDNSKIKFYCTVTNVVTGNAEYIEINNSKEQIEILRAGASMPVVSKIVSVHNKQYLDGGMADSIPIKQAIKMGYDKIIVVLTRPLNYRKKEKKKNHLTYFYKKYPKFQKTIKNRSKNYNKTLDYITKLEQENKVFVIRPSADLKIKRIEHRKKKIQAQYDLGKEDYQKKKQELKQYLALENKK